MKTLQEIYDSIPANNCDKGSFHSYLEYYSELFAPYRETADHVLEVGVRMGDSLRMWAGYFSNATIWGIDNGSEAGLPRFTEEEQERIRFVAADTTDPSRFLWNLTNECNAYSYGSDSEKFDIVIDDGNHHPYAQAATFALLSPFVKPGGIYLIEDIEDISFASTMQRLFGGQVVDRREVRQRHDDILLVWRKPKS